MNRINLERRRLRKRINSNLRFDTLFHVYITLILLLNVILILFALLSILIRMTLNGVGIIDSIPIALYFITLMVFLPWMTKAFYTTRASAWNFIFLMISSVFFIVLSILLRGLVICVILNTIAILLISIIGRFRPQGNLHQTGKKVIAYVILLNMLGLSSPVSIIVMGQLPIASTSGATIPNIILGVPLANFDFPYSNIRPTESIVLDLEVSGFGVDLRVLENNTDSWYRLDEWLNALNESLVSYTITLTSDRSLFVGETPTAIGTTEVIQQVYASHKSALTDLAISLENINNLPQSIIFDMTLSQQEWQKLMFYTRSLDIIGFSNLMRTSIYSINNSVIDREAALLAQQASSHNIDLGILIESFVIDDLLDNDDIAMRVTGVTIDSLSLWDTVQVSCSRSRFSLEMLGDVEAYLVESYSKSVGIKDSNWTMRIGEISNITDVDGKNSSVYETINILTNDIRVAVGNGVDNLTVDSLPSLLSSYGQSAIMDLYNSLSTPSSGFSNYTFRIYAYRALFIAIDSFDILLL